MTLSAGTRIGHYEIVAAIGSGGMGDVYRARDAKLNRDVALKVVPDVFADDPERLARFQREAQVLASLNHPNIAAIYGLEDADGVRALVLELVDGPTLAEWTAEHADRGAQDPRLHLEETLAIARQIAEALEAAHEHGIIHRDLKPSNIKLRPDGTVKVLDFGLAKLADPKVRPAGTASLSPGRGEGRGERASQSPTLTSPGAPTRMGVIMGTAAYMSPEQARGKPVDTRTDIWAFGCVLYEMLAGHAAFRGETVTDILGAIVKMEPDWTALPPDTPSLIRRLLRRCLAKDLRDRLHDIGDARLEVVETLTAPASEPLPLVAARPAEHWRAAATVSVVALVAAALAGTSVWLAMRPAPPRVARVTITPTGAAALNIEGMDRDLTITPDGTRVVYVGTDGTQLFVRPLDQLEPTAIATGELRGVFTSPDGQWVGFVDRTTTLRKVAITGGPPVTLVRIDGPPRGATWLLDETIVFATSTPATGLQRVSAAGGVVTVLTRPNRDRGEVDHLWPEALPGGRALLFTITPLSGGLDAAQVAVLDLAAGTQATLVRGGSHAHYVASGHLVYTAGGTLRAVAFDLDRLAVRGTPVPVLPRLVITAVGAGDFAVAEDGTLVYVDAPGGGASAARTLVWVDRQGREEPLVASPRAYEHPRVSPDGTSVVVASEDQEQDLWIWNIARGPLTRLTFEPGRDNFPVWAPDGRRLVFSAQRAGGVINLYWQAADGTGAAERLTESSNIQRPTGITPEGTRVVFHEVTSTLGRDLWLLTLGPDRPSTLRQAQGRPESSRGTTSSGRGEPVEPRRVTPLLETRFDEYNGVVSPDGRWLAYQSDSSGQLEIYVRPFPNVGDGQWQVSTVGGTRPLWARSGRELFYVAPDGALMAVPVEPRGAQWHAGPPAKLLEGRYVMNAPGNPGRNYDVSPDGQRFLMIKQTGADPTAPPQIVVVQNWFEELKRLLPTR